MKREKEQKSSVDIKRLSSEASKFSTFRREIETQREPERKSGWSAKVPI